MSSFKEVSELVVGIFSIFTAILTFFRAWRAFSPTSADDDTDGQNIPQESSKSSPLILLGVGLLLLSGGALFEYRSTISQCSAFLGDWTGEPNPVTLQLTHKGEGQCHFEGRFKGDSQQLINGTTSGRIGTGYLLRNVPDTSGNACFTIIGYDFELQDNGSLDVTEHGRGCGLEENRTPTWVFTRVVAAQ